mmetsp:Transcript_20769/g.34336  ORF Transcript_20769/g.34336 Transcript_20769/m.34336 type:complete len:379 (-) Transcript_20769:66-1202(-)
MEELRGVGSCVCWGCGSCERVFHVCGLGETMSTKGIRQILSGMQPTGVPTLGNYMGAIRNWKNLQELVDKDGGDARSKVLYMVADYHSITTNQEPEKLRSNILDLTATCLASGLDPAKCSIFQQSSIPGHAALGWVASCATPIGWLNRMTQFKEKAGKQKERAGLGLFAYPSLMAADILLYKATHVPVGEDQRQHLEFTRDLATRMNLKWGKQVFVIPEPIYVKGSCVRVMSLKDGTKKMSKSDPSEMSRIEICDDADLIARKIKKAKTDSLGTIDSSDKYLKQNRPEVHNLVSLHAALLDRDFEEVLLEFNGAQVSQVKQELIASTVSRITPIGAEFKRLRADVPHLKSVLANGAEVAGGLAEKTMREVHACSGLGI